MIATTSILLIVMIWFALVVLWLWLLLGGLLRFIPPTSFRKELEQANREYIEGTITPQTHRRKIRDAQEAYRRKVDQSHRIN